MERSRVDVCATLTSDSERHAALFLVDALAAGVDIDRAILWTFGWLEAIERWRQHLLEIG